MQVYINDYQTHFDVIAHVGNEAYRVNQWCDQTGIHGQWHYFIKIYPWESPHHFSSTPMVEPAVFFNGVDRNTAVMIQLGLK